MSLGENIARIMEEQGITGKELAVILNTSQSYISEIKNDKQLPSLKKLKEIAKVLNVEEYELFKECRKDLDREFNINDNIYDNNYFVKDEIELIELYRQLPEDKKIEIKGEIKGMLRVLNEEKKEDKKGA